MFTGILIALSIFSVYTSVVHASDSHPTVDSHILQPCDNTYTLTPSKIVCIASVVKRTRWRVPVKTSRKLSLAYMSLLLVTLSSEIELNPGPSFPCGSCGIEVLDEDAAVSCDNCNIWYHIQCQDISLETYGNLQANDLSFAWECLNCEAQNYSSISNLSATSFLSENGFSALDSEMTSSSIGSPLSGNARTTPPKSKPQKFPKLTVLNINFQSVRNKIPDFHALISSEQPDIIIATESWLTPDILSSEIVPANLGYSIFREDRTSSSGGGVFIMVKGDIIVTEQKEYKTDCEIVWVKIEIVGTRPLLIAAYYRPKEGDSYSADEFHRSLEMVSQQKGDIWVLGDFNYPKMDWDEEDVPFIRPGCTLTKLYDGFIETLNDFNLMQMVREPTRGGNILDLFLTTNHTLVESVSIIPGLSDHNIVKCIVNSKPKVVKKAPRKTLLYRKADWASLKVHMQSFCHSFLSSCEGKSVEVMWTEFKEALNSGIQKFVPSKFAGNKKHLPWITQAIKRELRKRDRLYNKFKKSKDSKDRKAFLNSKHGVKRKIKTAYEKYLLDILGLDGESGEQNQAFSRKKLFSFLKSSKSDAQGIALLKKGDNVCTNDVDQANLLNAQFQSVFSIRAPLDLMKLCHTTMLNGANSLVNLLPESLQCKFPIMHDIEISTAGVCKLLSGLNVSKAAGPDAIRPLVLKQLCQEIAPVVAVIFQTSFNSGIVPTDWKKAQVCPLFKKGNKTDPANYRPISLTCILCKTMEHIIASTLTKHFNQHNILYDLQHGFRERRSCETQLIQLVEDLSRNMISGKQTDLILLDFSKAFDKVNHLKLLYKLQTHGVQGKALRWIESFLVGRSQTVVLNGNSSDELQVSSGVPQGSVLGPILFLLYINDLPDSLQSQVRLFADDTAVYLTVQGQADSKKLQNDLDILQEWEREWDMEFNPSKCQVVHITRSRRPINTSYSMHGQVLDSVDSARYLGVDITSDLNFTQHINRTTSNASKSLGYLKRNILTKHSGIREAAYKTIVRPQVEYASTVWSPHTKKDIHKIEMVQRRAIRWTQNSYSTYASVTQMQNELGLRSLEQRRADARVIMLFKIVHGLVAIPLPSYFEQPSRMTRYSHPLALRQIHTSVNYYKYSFFPAAVVYWNKLPCSVVTLPTLDHFSVAVRSLDHLMF